MTNVVLKDIRKTTIISLPSYPESEVILYDGLLFGEVKKVFAVKEDLDRGIFILQHLIKDWNFTNEEGAKLKVSEETLNQLPIKDLQILMDKANEILADVSKKNEKSSKKQ